MNDRASIHADNEGAHIRGHGYTAEAGWFGPEDRPRFGWLYRPDEPAANGVGVVIVPRQLGTGLGGDEQHLAACRLELVRGDVPSGRGQGTDRGRERIVDIHLRVLPHSHRDSIS